MIEWRTDIPAAEWDRHLAVLGGHPLQSALWGDARRAVDGINDQRWMASIDQRVVLLARVEPRTIPVLGRAAWMPRGPVMAPGAEDQAVVEALLRRLASERFLLCIDDPYRPLASPRPAHPLLPTPRTAWIDLAKGRDAVWKATDRQWRYGVRAAERAGVIVQQTRSGSDAEAFFLLCEAVSRRKKFELPGSAALLKALLQRPLAPDVEARLFEARVDARLAAGAVVLRVGSSLHYFWGGVDRAFSKQRVGEAVQGAILEWALDAGITRYDLEGIDPVANPGTYQFKMKMGAEELELPGRRAFPLSMLGHFALAVGRRMGRL